MRPRRKINSCTHDSKRPSVLRVVFFSGYRYNEIKLKRIWTMTFRKGQIWYHYKQKRHSVCYKVPWCQVNSWPLQKQKGTPRLRWRTTMSYTAWIIFTVLPSQLISNQFSVWQLQFKDWPLHSIIQWCCWLRIKPVITICWQSVACWRQHLKLWRLTCWRLIWLAYILCCQVLVSCPLSWEPNRNVQWIWCKVLVQWLMRTMSFWVCRRGCVMN